MAEAETRKARSKGRPTRLEAEQLDAAICDAVIDAVLSEGGPATMEAIAAAAGITRKGLYGRYPDRNLLMTTTVRRLLAQAVGIQIDYSAEPEAALYGFARLALDLIGERGSRATQSLLRARPPWIEPLLPEILEAHRRHFIQPLSDYFARCNIRGTLSVSDPQLAAKAIVLLLNYQNIQNDIPGDEDGWRDDYAKFVIGIVYSGMKPRPSS